MADDKSARGEEDRRLVSADEPYEVAYFANRHGITSAKAKAIIEEHGPSRDRCDKAVEALKGK